jgi:myo-inositol 2-dehydrogenase/D-chiro-inositol 1-dehydrogenase
MTRPIGIGLIGCGAIGQIHADGLAKLASDGELRPVMAADPSPEARAATQRNCPFESFVEDAHAVIEHPEVEAVLVTSPTLHHADSVLQALERGKAIMCEKPLAPTFEGVRELVEAVVGSGVVAQVGFHSRFNPMFCRLRDLVVSGELGRPLGYVLREDQFWPTGAVVAGHSSWRADPNQAGGGALLEHTIHGCDLVSWMFGPATSVSGRTRSLFGFGVEDMATVQVEHQGGAIGTVATVFNGVEGREERRLEVFFEHATVEVTGDFIIGAAEDALVIHRPGGSEQVDLAQEREARFASWGIERRDFIFYQYLADRNFVRSVRAGEPASPGFEDAYVAHALVDAAYRSASADGALTTTTTPPNLQPESALARPSARQVRPGGGAHQS